MTTKQDKPQADVTLTDVTIDPEFQDLLPALTSDEYKKLEQDLKENGCRDPLVSWLEEGILIDGHNRYKICNKHGIDYDFTEISFASREDVIDWIIENQSGRRNMTKFRWAELALKFKDRFSKEAKENQKAGGGAVRHKSDKPVKTLEKLAEIAKVSHETINRVAFIRDNASKEDIDKLRMGFPGVSINKVYRELKDSKKDSGKEPKDTKKSTQGKGKPSIKNVGKRLGGVLTTLKSFESKLSQKGDQTKMQNLITKIEKMIKEVEA